MKTRLLSRKDIEGFFTMRMCMEAVEKAFADLATGNATMPQRTPIIVPDHHGLALFMPAHIKSLGALGAKVVTVYKDNVAKHSLPTVLGTIILLDEATGFPVALMDGGYLTAMRTGAVSGVATKYMARPEAKVAALFGTGVQAFTQVLGVHEARPLTRLLAYSIDPADARKRFAHKITEQTGVPVELVDDPAAAAAHADIVILATTAATPIVDGRWFAPGTHINGVGSHAPKMRELDSPDGPEEPHRLRPHRCLQGGGGRFHHPRRGRRVGVGQCRRRSGRRDYRQGCRQDVPGRDHTVQVRGTGHPGYVCGAHRLRRSGEERHRSRVPVLTS